MASEASDPDEFKPGSLGCHEALHMASFLATSLEMELLEHPSILLKPAWHAHVQAAHDALVNLYNDIARDHLMKD